MHTTIEIDGKPVEVFTSREADSVLSRRTLPLTVEMELFFSYPLRKKIRFMVEERKGPHPVHITEKLSVSFRPLTQKNCSKDDAEQHPVMDFPIVKTQPYIPKWLNIDFRFGHWLGEFGYTNGAQSRGRHFRG
jgi:hypothetical protein